MHIAPVKNGGNMQNLDIEDVPEAVKSKKITMKEAVDFIWADAYTNPGKYGMYYLSEDSKSDLLLEMYGQFDKILERFNPRASSFRTYITSCIILQKRNHLRRQEAGRNARDCLSSYLTRFFENSYSTSEEDSREKAESKSESQSFPFRTFSDIREGGKGSNKKRSQKIAELTLLILLMKACRDADDQLIETVCDFTGISKALIYEKLQELKESYDKKRDSSYQMLLEKRNNAFYFHRKYMYEMINGIASKQKFLKLQKRYQAHTRQWKINNQKLAVRSTSPSNEEIAKILGLKPRTVSYYISHIQEDSNIDRLKDMIDGKNEAESEESENEEDDL